MALISLRIRVSCPFDGPPSVPSVALYLSILTSFPSPTFSLCSKPRGHPATPRAQPGAPSLGPFLQIPKRLPSSPLVLKQWDALKRLLLTSPHGHPTGMSSMGTVISIPNLFFFPVFFFFLGSTLAIWKFPGEGSNWSYSFGPTPQPQPHGIQVVSVTYTTAQGNARSSTQ